MRACLCTASDYIIIYKTFIWTSITFIKHLKDIYKTLIRHPPNGHTQMTLHVYEWYVVYQSYRSPPHRDSLERYGTLTQSSVTDLVCRCDRGDILK